MSLQYEESVLDFDLDFFTQTSNNASPEKIKGKNEKCRQAINVAKRKIVATDSLIRKYYNKKEELDQLEKALYSSKEECKKICIDFQNVTERCNQLDAEAQILRNFNQQLQEKCGFAESQVDALQSHAHQLQTLVKENETVIEGLKVENQLEKVSVKDYEKKITTHQKENDNLLKHIYMMKDVILGKKKLTKNLKEILDKYKSKYESDDNDSVLEGGGVESDDDHYFDSPKTPEQTYKEELHHLSTQTCKDYTGKIESVITKSDNDLESDFSNERASADTGRGSSLAFSDSDKCFHSPDYFMENSPIDTNGAEKLKSNLVDTATSPIFLHKFANTATSPIAAKQCATQYVHTATSPMSVSISEKINESSRSVQEGISGITPLSPNKFKRTGNKTVFTNIEENISDEETADSSTACHEYRRKECLERNNSDIFDDHESRDGEIESILSKMRLTHSLITPIPTTPKSQKSLCTSTIKHFDICTDNFVCKDALKVKEENGILKANIMKLASEIESIKEVLKIKHLPHQLHPNAEKQLESDFCEDIISIQEEVDDNAEVCEGAESLEMNISCNDSHSTEIVPSEFDSRKGIKRLEFEEPLVCHQNDLSSQSVQEQDFDDNVSCDIHSNENVNSSVRKAFKRRKLTKLDRLRQKLTPKNKIKSNLSPNRKVKKQTLVRKMNKKAVAALTNKKAYEKAVKIMSEFKLKEKKIKPTVLEKIEKHNFKQTNILDNILGLEISPKIPITVPSACNENTSCKDLTKPNSRDEQNPIKHNSNRIIILEDILLTQPHDSNLNLSTPSPVKSIISNKPTADNLQIKIDADKNEQTNSPQFKSIHVKEDEKTIPCLESEESYIADLTKTVQHVKEDEKTIPCLESEESYIADLTKTVQKSDETTRHKENKQIPDNIEEECKSSDDSVRLISFESEIKDAVHESDAQQIDTENMKNKYETNIITKHSNETLNLPNEIHKPGQVEFVSPTTYSKESTPRRKLIATRSRTKLGEHLNMVKDTQVTEKNTPEPLLQNDISLDSKEDITSNLPQRTRKRQKRTSVENFECKRMLRSSTSRLLSPNERNKALSNTENTEDGANTEETEEQARARENVISYSDIEMYSACATGQEKENVEYLAQEEAKKPYEQKEPNKESYLHPKHSILCVMINKYGKDTIKDFSKRVPDSVINTISKTIDREITVVIESSSKDARPPMNKFVETIEKWDHRQFMAGLMKYLKNPQRKIELFNKVSVPSVPPMTKAEQILLYVISQLKTVWTSIDVVDCLLSNIEYVLFKLNRTPEFDTVESMSHFYAIMCRYFKMKSRLRVFMLDAMYCMQFKAIPLIKQCMEVWMHVLPLAHMGIAKNPLVTCMVYLLHFYKCEDKFNRVQEIRHLLNRKYFYEITEWNDAKIIEMFRNAINDVKVMPLEMKLLRLALIVIAKRYGPQWCQKNMIKNLLLPMIESDTYPERVKVFCVSMLGPILKPYPMDMRVHYEIIINMLLDMRAQNPSPKMEEAIFTSLIYMSRLCYSRVVQTLLTWKPQHDISPEFENVIRDFVSEKPLRAWKGILCKIST